MTENKRFTYDNKQVAILKNNEFWLDGAIDTACNHSEICNELNALVDENKQLKEINRNLGDFRDFITEQNVLNEKQRKELQLQMLRLYNYFENYFEDTMNPNAFSEMWDNVKEDEKWEKRRYND